MYILVQGGAFRLYALLCKLWKKLYRCTQMLLLALCIFVSWGVSSNGRGRALHARGSGIDARILHKKLFPLFMLFYIIYGEMNLYNEHRN